MNSAEIKSVDRLLALIEEKLSGVDKYKYKYLKEHGPLDFNGFSITFWINFEGDDGKSSVYLKIPKIIWDDNEIDFNSPITKLDRTLAKNEFDSLNYLSENWSRESGVSFINPLGYIDEYNAILTERIYGDFFFNEFLNEDFKRKMFRKSMEKAEEGLYKFGKSLREFHQKEIKKTIFNSNQVLKKPFSYLETLKKYDLDQAQLLLITQKLNEYKHTKYSTSIVNNLKGICLLYTSPSPRD